MIRSTWCRLSLLGLCWLGSASLVQAQPGGPPLGAGPWAMKSFEQDYLKVSVVARNLDHPFGIALLPGTASPRNPFGDALISERTGKIKLLHNGIISTDIVADLTKAFSLEQLFDLKLHPKFAQNKLVYFTYIKTAPRPDGSKGYWVTTALGRGRWDGKHLVDLKDVFVAAKAWSGNIGGASSRLQFLADGTVLLGVSHRVDTDAPQKLNTHIGKILRLNDDGSVPKDNPFIGVEGAEREIYTYGNRSVMDFAVNPLTGAVWELENGPQGGDEVNILKPGTNYGWPIANYGRDYDGKRFSPQPWVAGTQLPEIYWVPSITVAGMTFYTGSKFPKWKNNLFVTSMIRGRIPGTGHLERVVFNDKGEVRREELFNNLQQRIRYVIQGPDELLYLLTDEKDGAMLRIEPSNATEFAALSAAAGTPEAVGKSEEVGGLNATPVFAALDCKLCHRDAEALIGPSWQAIAKRYPLTDANVDLLAGKIIKGGEGVWGETPMVPHADLKPVAVKAMVKQILQVTGK